MVNIFTDLYEFLAVQSIVSFNYGTIVRVWIMYWDPHGHKMSEDNQENRGKMATLCLVGDNW